MTTKVKLNRGVIGMPRYVPGRPIEEIKQAYGLSDVIKLASNENTLGTSPRVLAAVAQVTNLNYYPDPLAQNLAAAIAARLRLSPDWILVGNGADAIIHTIARAYLEDDDEAIMGAVSFTSYEIGTRAMRGRPVKVAMRNYGLDLEAMASAVGPRTKVIFTCNPNNPTGTTFTKGELARFMERVSDEVMIVFDQAYHEYAESPEYADGLEYIRQGRKNVMVLRTFSKVYGMAGLRLGYAVAHPSIVAPLYETGERFPINHMAQVAGMAALEDHEWARKTVALARSGCAMLYRRLEKLGLEFIPSHANFLMVRLGDQWSQMVEALLCQGVIVRPGAGFGMPGWVRVTVGTRAENERFLSTLEQTLEAASLRELYEVAV